MDDEKILMELQAISEKLDEITVVSEAAEPIVSKVLGIIEHHLPALNSFFSNIEKQNAERLLSIYEYFRKKHNYDHEIAMVLTELYIDYFNKPEKTLQDVSERISKGLIEHQKAKNEAMIEFMKQQQRAKPERPSAFGRK